MEAVGFERMCRAQWAYEAQAEGELSFGNGDVIEILEKRPDSWWKGKLGGMIGIFPANYVVEDVDEEDGWVLPGLQLDTENMTNKRDQILNEIIRTEWDYILDLQVTLQV